MSTKGKKSAIDFLAYHRSLAKELDAVKDRVRHLIPHWPTDGTFKESVLRSVLRRHLPESVFIGTGFIVTPQASSKQIDLLIVDKERPRLFWDGDLVIVTPDAVRAAIEVKTGLSSRAAIDDAIMKLAETKKVWHKSHYGWDNWLGLFAYEVRGDHGDGILRSLARAKKEHGVSIDCAVFGPDLYFDWVGRIGQTEIKNYASRNLEGMAAACFITKLVAYFSEASGYSNPLAWQPHVGKTLDVRYVDDEGAIHTLKSTPNIRT